MKHLKDTAKKVKTLVELLCHIQKIPIPEIYFIQSIPNFILFNSDMEIISYDKRDADIELKYLKYVHKECSLYININLLKMSQDIPIYIIRVVRGVYQCHMADRFEKGEMINDDARMFHYRYFEMNNANHLSSSSYSITEVDKNAFCIVIMKNIFNREISFPSNEKPILDNRVSLLEKEYSVKYINKFIKRSK